MPALPSCPPALLPALSPPSPARPLAAQAHELARTLGARRAEAEAALRGLERDYAEKAGAANERLWLAAREGDLAELDALLALGADPNAGDPAAFGRTALHLAAYHGRAAAAERLVRRGGARLGAASAPLGWTPLHYAAQRGHAATAAALVALGADPAARNGLGKAPHALARLNGHRALADRLEALCGPAAAAAAAPAAAVEALAAQLRAQGLSEANSTAQVSGQQHIACCQMFDHRSNIFDHRSNI